MKEFIVLSNILGFLLMGADKLKARRGWWRIPETVLFLNAALLGAAGVLAGMRVFRHKTKKRRFVIGIPLLLLVNILSAYYIRSLLPR